MTELMILSVGTFIASFAIGFIYAELGDPLGLGRIGLFPRQ